MMMEMPAQHEIFKTKTFTVISPVTEENRKEKEKKCGKIS